MQKDEGEEVIKSDSQVSGLVNLVESNPSKIKQKGSRKKSLVGVWLDYLQGIF